MPPKIEELAERLGHYAAKTGSAAEQIQKKIEEKGGLGEIVQENAEHIGKGAGSAVGKVAKFTDGVQRKIRRIPRSASEIYNEGTVDVPAYEAAGQQIGAEVAHKVRDTAKDIVSGVGRIASDITNVVNATASGARDYAPQESRTITIGTKHYQVGSEKLSVIAATKEYASQIDNTIHRQAGRQELLEFVTKYAVRNTEELEQRWKEIGMTESNAYRKATQR